MSLFDEFCLEGEAAVARWLRDRQPEDDFSEFKSGALFDNGSLTRSGRQQVGSEVAGMANAGGGTLFIGIGTENVDSLDVASTVALIEEVDRALSHLKGQIDNLVQPPVPDLQFEVVRTAVDPTKGFIAIRVLRSDRRPHMCRAPQLHTYFKRSGTSTMPMSAFEVEDQLNRTRRADLEADIEVFHRSSIAEWRRYRLVVKLRNVSDLSAFNAYVGIRRKEQLALDSHHDAVYGFSRYGLHPKQLMLFAEPQIVIPPGDEVTVCDFTFGLASIGGEIVFREDHGSASKPIQLNLEFAYGCKDMRQRIFVWSLSSQQALELYQ